MHCSLVQDWSLFYPCLVGEWKKRNPSLGTRLSAPSPPGRFYIGCTMYLRHVSPESRSRLGSRMKLLGGRNKNRSRKGLALWGGKSKIGDTYSCNVNSPNLTSHGYSLVPYLVFEGSDFNFLSWIFVKLTDLTFQAKTK